MTRSLACSLLWVGVLLLAPSPASASAFFRLLDAQIVGKGAAAKLVVEVCLDQSGWNNPVDFFVHDRAPLHGLDESPRHRHVRDGYPIASLPAPSGCTTQIFTAPLAAVRAQLPGLRAGRMLYLAANWPSKELNNGLGHFWGCVLNNDRCRLVDTSVKIQRPSPAPRSKPRSKPRGRRPAAATASR